MEVVDENKALLSNFEVYSLLKEVQAKNKGRKGNIQQNLATISYETIKYLEGTPCLNQSAEIIGEFLPALKPYNLTKAEKLQILNNRPSTAVEIQLIVEESEERLSEEQIEEILSLIKAKLPSPTVEPAEENQ